MFSRCLFKDLIPSKKTVEFLKEGARALERHDFEAAKKAYESVPPNDKNNKFVQGFLGKIEASKKVHKMTKELNESLKRKSP